GSARMLETELSGEEARRAGAIIEAANELLETSDNTRHISRYTANSETKVRDVSPIVKSSIRTLRETFPSVEVDRDIAVPCRARIAEGFSLAVDNLLENAVKHNDANDPWISVRLRCAEHPELVVEDDGPGIPESELKPLETGEEQPLEHVSGTGLWLVKLLVENSNGTIAFDETDDGTRVTVSLDGPPTHGVSDA
ncbi:MAG: sensor histidine kinase, partial [Halanaeroarchaeum sp.]